MESVLQRLATSREAHVEELRNYLRIPSISSSPDHREAVADAARFTAGLLHAAGLRQVEVLPTAGHPAVVGAWRDAPGRPTVLIYGHYDVQPVDPLAEWESPPFDPRVADERVWARGATDDKGQIFMHIKAVEAILATHGRLPVNVVFLIEGEEEIGSPNLGPLLNAHRDFLRADVAVVSDSYMWQEGIPAITTSLRGLVYLELEVTGPNRDLHSGTYGGAVANPVEMLARALARVKDDQGRVRIPGFYDQVREMDADERRELAAIPLDEAAYWQDLGVSEGWGEAGFSPLERIWRRPTFEVNGLWGGYTGPGSKTVLPARAGMKFSMRLVPDQDPDALAALAEAFFRAELPETVTVKVTRHPGGGRAVQVPRDLPALGAARRALAEAFGREPLLTGEGGSIPVVADFQELLGIHTLLIGFGLPDARAHSPNESLHLPTFHAGIDSLVRLFHHLGG